MDKTKADIFTIIIAIGAPLLLYVSSEPNLFEDNNTYDIPIGLLLLISLTYFVVDFVMMIYYYEPKNNVYFLHHGVGIVAIILVVVKHYYFVKYLLGYLSFELTTPFLNRYLPFKHAKKSTTYSIFVGLCFFIGFILVRILFGTYLTVNLVCAMIDQSNYYLIMLPAMLQSLNYYWLWGIIKLVARTIGASG